MNITDALTCFWVALTRLPIINKNKFFELLKIFNSIEKIFSATTVELKNAGLTKKEINFILNVDWEEINKILKWCEQSNCKIITIDEDAYPSLLKEIPDPPLILYVQGEVELLSRPQIAIVGSRNPTPMGLETAFEFAAHLAKEGFVITSGLALGIDVECHRGALTTGSTIAVMGTGLNCIYPFSHQKLSKEIIDKGVLVSEFQPNEPPKARNFPLRNRIISGLSLGVLVVEAALYSGSLITARMAVEQGREVFAIPGSIHNPLARGCHYLIREGAKLIEKADDILEELSSLLELVGSHKLAENFSEVLDINKDISEKEKWLMSQIGHEITSFDTIIVRSGLTASELSSILLALELKGHLRLVTGGYVRNTR